MIATALGAKFKLLATAEGLLCDGVHLSLNLLLSSFTI